mmetsp:Transcript_2662/g.1878  ORF Transcript_2662/g.1878 Transcript_2662/m.1878 type:complete len:91 (+) Transcript_2662:103-375(+)
MIVLMFPILVLCLIPNFTIFATVSKFAIAIVAFVITGITITSINIIHESGHTVSEPVYFNIRNFFAYIGVAIFIFEGGAVCLNIRGEAMD